MKKKAKVYILVNSHFDLMWRRPFKNSFENNGKNFVSYADIEAYYIIDNIKFAKEYDFYRFEIESPAVLRTFVEKYPEYMEDLKSLFSQKKIGVSWTGDNIVDSNMSNGESIVRNYIYGKKYLEDTFGYTPRCCNRDDAFGNSAQLPQIIKKLGMNIVFNIAYTPCNGDYWRGLDGSTVVVGKIKNVVGVSGGYYKYAPCPHCNGFKDKGCKICGGRGIDINGIKPFVKKINNISIDESADFNIIKVWSEEIISNCDSIKWYIENKEKYDIEYITNDELYEIICEEYVKKLDNPPNESIHPMQEINPNNTGTYVTRIETKRRLKKCEGDLFTLEGLVSAIDLSDKCSIEKRIEKVWENIHFTMFHDAVTGTHVDSANRELMDVFDNIDKEIGSILSIILNESVLEERNRLSVYNPLSFDASRIVRAIINSDSDIIIKDGMKVLPYISYSRTDGVVTAEFLAENIPAYGIKEYTIEETNNINLCETEIINVKQKQQIIASEKVEELVNTAELLNFNTDMYEINNEFYCIKSDNNGIIEIYDKEIAKPVSKVAQYRPLEMVVEHDEGSPWTTLSTDTRRVSTAIWTSLLRVEKSSEYERLVFKISPFDTAFYSIMGFYAEVTVTLYRKIKQIDVKTNIFWDTYNQRVRIALPSCIDGKHFYEIPFGYIERLPYEPNIVSPQQTSNWAAAAGDWPTMNWAGITNSKESIALLNKGIPSYQINKDDLGCPTIFVTPLRSPCVPTYLHDTQTYTMTDFDGMRDVGEYNFEFAVTSYMGDFSENTIVKDGMVFNREFITTDGVLTLKKLPRINSEDVIITNVKVGEDESSLVFRLVDIHGKGAKINLELPKGCTKVYDCDLLENEEQELASDGNNIGIIMKPFEIKTIKYKCFKK